MGNDQTGDFWSRRRAGVAAEAQAEETSLRQQERDAVQAEVEANAAKKSDAEILAELGLKDPDDMTEGDDFKAFLQEAIPARLRQRALRALWRSNSVLANVDNLVDYGQDFTDSATVMENLQTTYQVGKGMLRHVQAMAAKAEAETEEVDAATPELEAHDVLAASDQEETKVVPSSEPENIDESNTTMADDAVTYDQSVIDAEAIESEPFVYRRMQFDFPDEDTGPSRAKGDA